MINSKEFTVRIQQLMDYYNLSSSSFADSIGVQRSSISHILSGRNKPSLDFVLKITKEYKEVELYWLLNGKGNFPPISTKINELGTGDHSAKEIDIKDNNIDRIVIFYTNGSFKEYSNKKTM